eukprot:136191_1
MQTTAGCIRNTVSITTLLIWQKLCTKMRCVIANHACCQCTEYKEPIPTNRSLPTGHYMGTSQARIEMILFKNPNYCFDEESLLLLFGDILKYFGYMSKDYNLKQCLLTVDAAKECLISMGTGKGAQRIVLQQMQSKRHKPNITIPPHLHDKRIWNYCKSMDGTERRIVDKCLII